MFDLFLSKSYFFKLKNNFHEISDLRLFTQERDKRVFINGVFEYSFDGVKLYHSFSIAQEHFEDVIEESFIYLMSKYKSYLKGREKLQFLINHHRSISSFNGIYDNDWSSSDFFNTYYENLDVNPKEIISIINTQFK